MHRPDPDLDFYRGLQIFLLSLLALMILSIIVVSSIGAFNGKYKTAKIPVAEIREKATRVQPSVLSMEECGD